jgi:hypothetical protein
MLCPTEDVTYALNLFALPEKFIALYVMCEGVRKCREIYKAILLCTANEGSVRIQYECGVPIYVFSEMKLLFPKQNYNVLSPNSYTHISVSDLYISKISLSILLQPNMWTDDWEFINRSQAHECGYWD